MSGHGAGFDVKRKEIRGNAGSTRLRTRIAKVVGDTDYLESPSGVTLMTYLRLRIALRSLGSRATIRTALILVLGSFATGCAENDALTAPSQAASAGSALPSSAFMTLTGTVSVDGVGIPGASVSILNGLNAGRTTQTDSNGVYSFDHLKAGVGHVRASAPGYVNETIAVSVDGAATQHFSLLIP
jgi:hypothetical protein